MDCKLTLKLDQGVIQEAKQYASQRGLSLSRLVEQYFRGLVRGQESEAKPTGLVAELAGLFEGADVEDSKEGYTEYLIRKYS